MLCVLALVAPISGGMAVLGAAGSAQAQDQPDTLFGRTGRPLTNFRPIPQWSTLLERFKAEERKNAECLSSQQANCPYSEWIAMILRVRNLDQASQITEVNSFANNWRYITDQRNWGKEDYWATPGEFFNRAGDCEDYAIVKFMSLRALGFPNEGLRLTAVQDLNLGVGHAVTVVFFQGRRLLLDNQISQVVETGTVHHYKPVFAANENKWWLFR